MKPTEFKEQNKTFKGTIPNSSDINTFQNAEQIISCWEMEMDEKLALILNGKVWLGVYGQNHPHVWLSAQNPFVLDGDKDDVSDYKVRLDRMIERKVAQFRNHCFTEGIDFDVDGEYGAEEILTKFLRFTFNLENTEESQTT